MSEGFLGRWSRRKQQVQAGEVPSEPVVPVVQPGTPDVGADQTPAVLDSASSPSGLPPEGEGEKPVLTLEDVKALTAESDFRPFVAKDVAPEVKNAAFKKLFADPHFNVMDGLDTYIDDYSKPTPLPESVLRQMASAKFLNLFEEEPEETPRDDGMPGVAQSNDPGNIPSPPVAHVQPASQEADDHHADLRLQPDDAARPEDDRDGAG